MEINYFIFNSVMLGVGLAMDAFSVSLANGLNEPEMKAPRMGLIAGMFALFQALMPMIGWICVHTVVQYFNSFESFIPWIALILLLFIGGKMIKESFDSHSEEQQETVKKLGISALVLQAVATSIDALSVGFTIADYDFPAAISCAAIIAFVTFIICFAGIALGKKFGTKLAGKAGILGGAILIFIGLEIFIAGVF